MANEGSDRGRDSGARATTVAPGRLGEFIRYQRQLANLSLRQLSALAHVSNPYLSQVERGVHQPSVRVLRGIADALDVSAETLLLHAGLLDGSEEAAADAVDAAAAIMADPRLSAAQRQALLAVYRSYVDVGDDGRPGRSRTGPPDDPTVVAGPRGTRRSTS